MTLFSTPAARRSFPSPTKKLTRLFFFLLPLFVLGIFIYPLLLLGLALDIFLLLAAIIDYRQGVKSNSLSFTPGGSTFFSIGKKNHITFTI
ncbi:MAG: hypothetical protein GY757_28880, partial [bacterium]|nr:hypothetical protein [bacterium]